MVRMMNRDWLEDVKMEDSQKHFEPINNKKIEAIYEWHDIFTDFESVRDMFQDLEDTSYMLAPNIWALQMFAAISAVLQGVYKDNKGGNLNIYGLAIGSSGAGKDAGRKYYKALFKALGLESFFLGDSLKSNLSLEVPLRKRQNNATGLALVDEIGSLLIKMSSDHVPDYLETLDGLLLSAYSSNEYTLPASSTNEATSLKNLNLCISGTSAMSKLVKGVTFDTIESGRMNRFFILEEQGGRCPNPRQIKREGEFSPQISQHWTCIRNHVNKIKNGYFKGRYGDPIKFMQVYFSKEDDEYVKNIEKKIIAYHTRTKISCPDAYVRIIETAKRITCICCIYEDYEKPVFNIKLFDEMLKKVKSGLDVLVDIAEKNKNSGLKETTDEKKTRLFNSIMTLMKSSQALSELGAKAGLIRKKILKAPKKYGYTEENYPDTLVMSVMYQIAHSMTGFRIEGEGKSSTLFYDIQESINETMIHGLTVDIADTKNFSMTTNDFNKYKKVHFLQKQLEELTGSKPESLVPDGVEIESSALYDKLEKDQVERDIFAQCHAFKLEKDRNTNTLISMNDQLDQLKRENHD